jgi:hypothetical protein
MLGHSAIGDGAIGDGAQLTSSNLLGVFCVASAGILSDSTPVSSVSSTTFAESLYDSIMSSFIGVSSTGYAGDISAHAGSNVSFNLAGVESASSAGSFGANISGNPIGVYSTCYVESIGLQSSSSIMLAGVYSACYAGIITTTTPSAVILSKAIASSYAVYNATATNYSPFTATTNIQL